MTVETMPADQTLTCIEAADAADADQAHARCAGYIAPASYGSGRLCNCPCHTQDNTRDFQRALDPGRRSA